MARRCYRNFFALSRDFTFFCRVSYVFSNYDVRLVMCLADTSSRWKRHSQLLLLCCWYWCWLWSQQSCSLQPSPPVSDGVPRNTRWALAAITAATLFLSGIPHASLLIPTTNMLLLRQNASRWATRLQNITNESYTSIWIHFTVDLEWKLKSRNTLRASCSDEPWHSLDFSLRILGRAAAKL